MCQTGSSSQYPFKHHLLTKCWICHQSPNKGTRNLALAQLSAPEPHSQEQGNQQSLPQAQEKRFLIGDTHVKSKCRKWHLLIQGHNKFHPIQLTDGDSFLDIMRVTFGRTSIEQNVTSCAELKRPISTALLNIRGKSFIDLRSKKRSETYSCYSFQ